MEKPDTLIIGAGIAGCGLAYNLKRAGYCGEVRIIDLQPIGALRDYGYRNTFREVIEEYRLPYDFVYKTMKFGDYHEIYFDLKERFYFVNYPKACTRLFRQSDAVFSRETALSYDIAKGVIKTDKTEYRPDFIIDASGNSSFLKTMLGQTLPKKYWYGVTRIFNNRIKDKDSFYYLFNENGYMEDVYPLGNRTLYGEWQYGPKVDFNNIQKEEKSLLSELIESPDLITEHKVTIPCSLATPLVHRNCAFLGDSFGNASPVAGEGLRQTLDSSRMLAQAILRRDLVLYDKEWRRKYLKTYISQMASKKDYKERLKIIKSFRSYPELYLKVLKGERICLPREIKAKIPKAFIMKQLLRNVTLRLKYM